MNLREQLRNYIEELDAAPRYLADINSILKDLKAIAGDPNEKTYQCLNIGTAAYYTAPEMFPRKYCGAISVQEKKIWWKLANHPMPDHRTLPPQDNQ